jgi:tetratricopeptide (TPR) repeat protein
LSGEEAVPVALEINTALALVDKAAELLDAEDYRGAIAVYTQLISEFPKASLYHQRGFAYSGCGEHSNAIDDFTRALEIGDDAPAETYVDRGNAYFRRNQLEEAVSDYSKAIQLLSPTLAFAYNGRGSAFHKMGRSEAAMPDLTMATQLDSSYVSALYNLAGLLLDTGNIERALFYLDKAVVLDATDVSVLCLRGEAYRVSGNFTDAVRDYERALVADPDSALPHRFLAWILSTCLDTVNRDGVRALAHAQTACEKTNWKSASYLDALAAAYAECGNFSEALRWQGEALKLRVHRKITSAFGCKA